MRTAEILRQLLSDSSELAVKRVLSQCLCGLVVITVSMSIQLAAGEDRAKPAGKETVQAEPEPAPPVRPLRALALLPEMVLSPEGSDALTPDVAVDRLGCAHVVWKGQDKFLYYAKVGPDQTIQIAAKKVYDFARVTTPRVAVDSAGIAHIITTPVASPACLLYIKVVDGNVSCSNEFWTLTPDTHHNWPSIDINPVTDLPVVCAEYHTRVDPYWMDGITVVTLDELGEPVPGSRWAAYWRQQLSAPSYAAEFPAVAVDMSGRAHCVWKHQDADWSGAGVGYSCQGQDGWSEISNLRTLVPLTGGPEIHRGAAGCVELVWSTTDGRVLWQRINGDGETVVDDTTISGPEAVADRPDISADSGLVTFAWSDLRDGGAKAVFSNDFPVNPLDARVSLGAGAAFNVAVATVDSSPRFVWQDNRDGAYRIYYRASEDVPHVDIVDEHGNPVAAACTDGVSLLSLKMSDLPDGVKANEILVAPVSTEEGSFVGEVRLDPDARQAWQDYKVPDKFAWGVSDRHTVQFDVAIRDVHYVGSLSLMRPPVVLLHGLWSRNAMWGSFRKRLVSTGFGFVYAPSYPNNDAFSANGPRIQAYVSKVLRVLHELNIAVKKVDIVAHSMGGCLTKGYVDPGHLRKVVTLDTPHRGSPLADAFYWMVYLADIVPQDWLIALFFDAIGQPILTGAVHDLRTSQPWISDRKEVDNLKIVGIADNTVFPDNTVQIIYEIIWIHQTMHLQPFPPVADMHDAVFQEPSDWIVGEASQRGDDGLIRSIPVLWHCAEGENEEFMALAIDFLDGNPLPGSPVPGLPSAHRPPGAGGSKPRTVSTDEETGEVTIVTPLDGETITAGGSVAFRVEGTGATDAAAVILAHSDGVICPTLPCEGSLAVLPEVKGRINLAVLGLNGGTGAVTDEHDVSLNVETAAVLESLRFEVPEPLILEYAPGDGEQEQFQLSVLATYNDGTFADVTFSTTGTTYESSDTDVVSVTGDGVVTVTGQGMSVLTARNNATATLDVVVVLAAVTSDQVIDHILGRVELRGYRRERADANLDTEIDVRDAVILIGQGR